MRCKNLCLLKMNFKGIFLTNILILVSFVSFGQLITLGMKIGTSISMYSAYESGKSMDIEGIRSLSFITGGLTLNLKISDSWCFHSEVIFEDKGNRNITHFDSISNRKIYDATQTGWRHNYFLQFPQTIRYSLKLSKKNRVSIYFEAGGYFAYYISTKYVTYLLYDETSEKTVTNSDIVDINVQGIVIYRFDWGATVGTGLLIPLWKGFLDLNFKYDHMIQPFIIDNLDGTKSYYSVFGVTIGYSLPVMKKYYN